METDNDEEITYSTIKLYTVEANYLSMMSSVQHFAYLHYDARRNPNRPAMYMLLSLVPRLPDLFNVAWEKLKEGEPGTKNHVSDVTTFYEKRHKSNSSFVAKSALWLLVQHFTED